MALKLEKPITNNVEVENLTNSLSGNVNTNIDVYETTKDIFFLNRLENYIFKFRYINSII